MSQVAKITKVAWIEGHRLRLRNATADDAAFIFSLRHDPARNQHMSATSAQLEDQVQWLERYAADDTQAYFIIETRPGVTPSDVEFESRLGTVRVYDARGDSFCWGSWMLVPGAPPFAAIESALMVYHYALELGFKAAHFEVAQGNAAVSRFHENFGAVCVGQAQGQTQYTLDHTSMLASLRRFRRFLPEGIRRGPFL